MFLTSLTDVSMLSTELHTAVCVSRAKADPTAANLATASAAVTPFTTAGQTLISDVKSTG